MERTKGEREIRTGKYKSSIWSEAECCRDEKWSSHTDRQHDCMNTALLPSLFTGTESFRNLCKNEYMYLLYDRFFPVHTMRSFINVPIVWSQASHHNNWNIWKKTRGEKTNLLERPQETHTSIQREEKRRRTIWREHLQIEWINDGVPTWMTQWWIEE